MTYNIIGKRFNISYGTAMAKPRLRKDKLAPEPAILPVFILFMALKKTENYDLYPTNGMQKLVVMVNFAGKSGS